jgi:hypothetical protein
VVSGVRGRGDETGVWGMGGEGSIRRNSDDDDIEKGMQETGTAVNEGL